MGWEEAENKFQDESPFDNETRYGYRKEYFQLWLEHSFDDYFH